MASPAEESPDELDHVPLVARRRSLLARNAHVKSEEKVSVEDDDEKENSVKSQELLGLPRGLRFDPTDGDLLHHLIGKIGCKSKTAFQHPLIDELIQSLDLDKEFDDINPQILRGVKQDGSISYFFHKPLTQNPHSNSARWQNPIGWQKSGKSTPVFMDGVKRGFKEVFEFFTDRSEKMQWVLNQYCVEREEGEEIAVSKLFYKSEKSETCTDSKESEKTEDSNQGQNGNFPKNHGDNELQLAKIKTEQESETHSALKTVLQLNACILKSEESQLQFPLEIQENEILGNEIRENEIPLNRIPSFSERAEKVAKVKPRKRKKTATDSVEQALEEDAPSLLKVLTEKGIIMGEIKLYDVGFDDIEPMEISTENDFQTLENVISKLFPDRVSLIKLTNAKNIKASKAQYCLACLISLIEQTRYLEFRKSPVEWGWCRDLQSFIFVFKTHNRIVLERPEYGYATYFFELIQSMPLDWQIKRLITAMKVNTSRASLIENKPLLVNEDLTESESSILQSYGWVPNTGIGTMLNFCDRVVHDRWRPSDGSDVSEWRAKIGRILTEGYERGSVVSCEDSVVKIES